MECGLSFYSTLDFGLVLAPTAASVSIKGSIVNSIGRSVSSAIVTLRNPETNEVKITRTNTFGKFGFDEIPVGNLYIITIQHKLYNFAPKTIQPLESIDNFQIMANDKVIR